MKNLQKLSNLVANREIFKYFVDLLANRTKKLEGEYRHFMAPYCFHSPVGIPFLLCDPALNSVVKKCHIVKGWLNTSISENWCKVYQGTNELAHLAKSQSWRMALPVLIEKKCKMGETEKKNNIKGFWLFFLDSLSRTMTAHCNVSQAWIITYYSDTVCREPSMGCLERQSVIESSFKRRTSVRPAEGIEGCCED